MLKKPRRPSAPSSSRPPHPSAPTPVSGVMDDVSHLSLADVRARLERNERLCNMLFRPEARSVPASPLSMSLDNRGGLPAFGASAAGAAQSDPVRDKLLLARQALQARENELILLQAQEGLQNVQMDESARGLSVAADGAESSADARRRASEGTTARARAETEGVGSPVAGTLRSGKMRALERIEAGEHRLAPGGLLLPVRDSLALSSRDYDNAAAQSLAALSLARPERPMPRDRRAASPTPRSRKKQGGGGRAPGYDETDEIARAQAEARVRAFMGYKGEEDDDDDYGDEEDDEDDGAGAGEGGGGGGGGGNGQLEDWGEDEGEYDGEEDRVELHNTHGGGWRERGTGEEVDEFGEDGEEWAEGNDQYFDRVRDGDEGQVNQANGV